MPPVHGISRRRVLVGLGIAIAVVSGAAIARKLATDTNNRFYNNSSFYLQPPPVIQLLLHLHLFL